MDVSYGYPAPPGLVQQSLAPPGTAPPVAGGLTEEQLQEKSRKYDLNIF